GTAGARHLAQRGLDLARQPIDAGQVRPINLDSDRRADTDATSGKLLMMRSEVCSSSAALVTDMPGTLTGIYISVPSLSVGMNSEPSRFSGISVAADTMIAIRMVASRARRTPA